MREERNKLLKESDIMMLSDIPHDNKEAWITYREKLRDFPAVWTEGTPFPSPPEYKYTYNVWKNTQSK